MIPHDVSAHFCKLEMFCRQRHKQLLRYSYFSLRLYMSLCFRHPKMMVKTRFRLFRCPIRLSVRPSVRSFVRPVKYCYHDISWTPRTIWIKLTEKEDSLAPIDDLIRLWMSNLEVKGQRSRLHLGSSMWWRSHPRRRWSVKVHLLNLISAGRNMREAMRLWKWSELIIIFIYLLAGFLKKL